MVTNAICAIIRTDDDGEYHHVSSYDCMWQGSDGYTTESYGENDTSKATVYIPDVNADVEKGDYIAKNALMDSIITPDFIDNCTLTVIDVAKHDYGSPDMQHIRAVAQ